MDRRDRDRYDRHDYDADYSRGAGYSRDDAHYHSARNLTNEFEQEYQSHHQGMDRERYMRDRDRGSMSRSYHEGDRGDAYERRNRGDRDYSGGSNYQQRDWDSNRNRSQGYASNYGSSSDRYNRYQDDFRREHDRYNRDRNRGQEQRGSMNQDNMRQGYGISDYDSMRGSSLHSDRGIPNTARRNYRDEDESDLGGTFDSRTYGISSGNYGAYGDRDRRYY